MPNRKSKIENRKSSPPGFTLIELLVAMAIALLISAALMAAVVSSVTFVRRSEGNVTASNTARAVFLMIDRDTSGGFAYPGSASADWLAGPGIDRSCHFRADSARWVTAAPNRGSADHLRVTWRTEPGDIETRNHLLFRDAYGWKKSWAPSDPSSFFDDHDLVARRVESIGFEARAADGTPLADSDIQDGQGGLKRFPAQVKVTLVVFAGTEADGKKMTFVRVFRAPAGQ